LLLSSLVCSTGCRNISKRQDVNAGPIFSNQQAQQVCPGACTQANANWNG